MRGPAPKDPKTRQRRNKEPTASDLVDKNPILEPPPIPNDQWGKRARDYWIAIWDSPMAREYTRADIEAVITICDLTHEYEVEQDVKLLAEIRQQRQGLGLTPLDRRRLGWKIEKQFHEDVPEPSVPRPSGSDPRSGLKAVS